MIVAIYKPASQAGHRIDSIIKAEDYSGLPLDSGIDYIELTQAQSILPITDIEELHSGVTPESNLVIAKKIVKDMIGKKRVTVEASGFSHTFSDGSGTVQTRDQIDIRNINGMVTVAMIANSQGETRAIFSFRDMENVTHSMTPTEVINLGIATNTFIGNTYIKSWSKKSEVDALTTIESVRSYSVETGW